MKLRLKRLLAGVLSVLLIGTIAEIPVNAASVDDLTYTISNGAVTITDCDTSASGELVIPETIEGYPVVSIKGFAFYGCDNLTSITIPSKMESVGYAAFGACDGLQNVYVADLETWCQIDFESASANPMYNATNLYVNGELLEGDLVIPNGITSIEPAAFSNCTGLTSVSIPSSVTSIGGRAFFNCNKLTSINIPSKVTNIESFAFFYCDSLSEVQITDLSSWCKIDFGDEYANPTYFSECLYLNENKLSGELDIPVDVTVIKDYSFCNCVDITNINIPSGVRSIGNYAFKGCENVISVRIPASVTTIGDMAFRGCYDLTDINIPVGLTSIGEHAFSFCTVLRSIEIPEGVTTIGDKAFCYCEKLSNVTIPASVTSIGVDVFKECPKLVLEVYTDYAVQYAEANNIDYISKVMTSLTIESVPNRTEYCLGETIDTKGLSLKATYGDGSSEAITNGFQLSGFDSTKAGTYVVTAKYKTCETSFEVTVREAHSYDDDSDENCNVCDHERVIQSLTIKTRPQKTVFSVNEEFDSTGLVIQVNYSDGTSKVVEQGFTTTGFDSSKEGTCTITVGYIGKETTFDVSVKVIPISDITFATPNIQIAMGDTYQSEIIYTPSNATYKEVSWKSLDESIATVNENGVISGVSKGTATIQATTENGITAECIVTVVNYKDISTSAEWLSISNRPTGMTYKLVADINVGSRVLNIPSSTDVVIDLNGHEVKGSGNIITNNGNLTIKDSSTGGKIYLYTESTNKTCDLIKNYGTMELAGGTLQIVSSAANQSYAMVDLHGVNNYGTLEIKDGKIFVNTFVESNNAGNYVNGIYNQSGGTVVMTGGEVTVETTTETYLSGNKTYSYIYGIYNESLNDLKILGGTINCIHSCWLMCNTNTVIVHALQNYAAANVILKDATINVQMGGNATEISGGVCGVYNNSYGNIKIDKTQIDVAADISKNIPVSGVNNSNIGSIIIGSDSTSTVENMQIMTSHATNYDSAIDNVDIGLIEVQRGKLEGYAGVCNLSTGRVELGVNDSRVDLSQLCIEATGAVIVSASQVNIYDGAFIGNLSSTVPIHIPDGYSLVKTSNNGVDEYVLIGKPLEAITLNKSELKIVEGRNATLTVQYTPADTTDDKTVIWSSSDENIATVDSDGNVTAIKPGTAVIGATVGKLTVTCNITVLSDNWVQDSVGWWYRNTDGTYPYNCWKEIDGEWYYFNASGYRVTGWLNLSGTWYYMNPKTGIMLSNEWLDNTYYFHGSGAMATGWVLLNGNYYYFNASGEKVTNQWVGSYYLKSNGVMATNEWVGSYYVDASGAYISSAGWLLIGNDWYYLGAGGVRQTGWLNLSGVWYYLNQSTGIMLSNGWLDNTYYFYGNGAMATGWVLINGDYYYFDASGAKVTNCWIGNYYLKSNGVMATNEWIGQYYVGSDGCWIPGYQNNPASNMQILKNYIQSNGSINSDGHPYISFVNSQSGTTSISGIVYRASTDELIFTVYAESDSAVVAISMNAHTIYNNILYPEFVLAYNTSNNGCIATATLNTANYTGVGNIYFSLDSSTGFSESDIQNVANASLRLGFTGWKILLSDIGLTLNSIGFTGYSK